MGIGASKPGKPQRNVYQEGAETTDVAGEMTLESVGEPVRLTVPFVFIATVELCKSRKRGATAWLHLTLVTKYFD